MSQETRDISLDGEVEDTTDPDVLDEHMDETLGEPEPEPEPMMEPEPLDEMNGMGDPQPTGLENEFKTVHGVHAPEPVSEPIAAPPPPPSPYPQEQSTDDDVLFGDAPDHRTKNPRYN
jgi:hypothetical protein